jgi:hypothetical protein
MLDYYLDKSRFASTAVDQISADYTSTVWLIKPLPSAPPYSSIIYGKLAGRASKGYPFSVKLSNG